MDEQQIVKPFEVRQDELIEKMSQEMMESGLPAGALVLIVEKVLVNLRQEAHRAVMAYRKQVEEQGGEEGSESGNHNP
ncbi:hypothetical protein [Kroppenstedtia guangzhouensis]|uniref:hypothetical protein n=1 Tax=Kroppenstedtia guangzhouensis TaxID=1274356 RepID=UPI0016671DFF|nr:hypothetical protein [Kroppenstedtia guangzhouensis]